MDVKEKRKITGAEIIVKALEKEKVDVVFEYPGGTIAPLLDALEKRKAVRVVMSRHEQGAIHAADSYARVTGKVGVCMATSGPGASNLVTGLANAYMDSVPLVAITGQVAVRDLRGSQTSRQKGFQELDIVSIAKSITKSSRLIIDVWDLPSALDEAFRLAITGRPGPVLVDVAYDLQYRAIDLFSYESGKGVAQGFSVLHKTIDSGQLTAACERILKSERPLIVAGGGVMISDAHKELCQLAHGIKIPVAMTLMGLGSFPASSNLCLGLIGYAGSPFCNKAVRAADVVLAVGTRFDNRAFPAGRTNFAEDAYIIHVDVDVGEFDNRVKADATISADAKTALQTIFAQIDQRVGKPRQAWIDQLEQWKREYPLTYENSAKVIKPQFVIEELSRLTKGLDTIITTDVGQHQMWTAQFFKFEKPRTLITSGGLGTMGFGLPAAIGAQIARPNAKVFNITGDGSFQMKIQELATAISYKLPIKILILNNECLGLVRQIQEFAFEGRFVSTILQNPDFAAIAAAHGAYGLRVTEPDDVTPALVETINSNRTCVVDFRIDPSENVFPIVVAGKVIASREEWGGRLG